MHRQSLGSPSSSAASKQQYPANGTVTLLTSEAADDEETHKLQRPHHRTATSEKLIHLIPLLTLLCFLVLYLSSHDPSQRDLAHFNGYKRLQKPIDSANMDDLDEILEIKKGDILGIRSLRNLQEIDKEASNYHRHRKIADF